MAMGLEYVCVRVNQCEGWESTRVCMCVGVYACESKYAHM